MTRLLLCVMTVACASILVSAIAAQTPETASGSVTGLITDANGRPMAAMLVRLRRILDQNRAQVLPYSAISDAAGRYTIANVPIGEYLVESMRDDTRTTSVYYPSALPYIPGNFWPQGASRVRVDPGQSVSGIDIRFIRRRITGQVVDSTGKPMPAAGENAAGRFQGRVILNRVGVRENPSGIPPDVRGRFSFDDIEPGEYVLRAVLYDIRPCDHCIATIATEFTARSIVVDGSDVDSVELQLQRATSLRGRIVAESGAPLDATALRMTVSQQGLWPEIRGNQDTMLDWAINPDGTFTIDGVVAATVVGVQNAPDGWFVKSISAGTSRRSDEPIPPDTRAEIVVVLSPDGARLAGRVLDPPPALKPGAFTVYLFSTNEQLWSAMRPPHVVASAVTGTGDYTLNSVAPGDYFIVVVATSTIQSLADKVRSANLRLDDDLKMMLQPLVSSARRISVTAGQSQTIDLPVAQLQN